MIDDLAKALETDAGRTALAAWLGESADRLNQLDAARLVALRTMPYGEYLQTNHWRMTADAAKERACHRCQLCNVKGDLETHHRTYERRGCEADEDLTVLCPRCHGKHHDEPERKPEADPETEALNSMSDEDQMRWLQATVARKRIEQGLHPATGEQMGNEPSQILKRSSMSSRA